MQESRSRYRPASDDTHGSPEAPSHAIAGCDGVATVALAGAAGPGFFRPGALRQNFQPTRA